MTIDEHALVERAAEGDELSWRALTERHQQRLRRLVRSRIDRRMNGRVDVSDVLQESFVEAWTHLDRFSEESQVPFFVWLRAIVGNKLLEIHRRHLGTEMRDAAREVSIDGRAFPAASSQMLALHLAGDPTPPSEALMRLERRDQLQQCLEELDPLDREVLALRHYEQLSNLETAHVLGISVSAASKRYIRALSRLKAALENAADMQP